ALPGEITPGQFGPMRRDFEVLSLAQTFTMSSVGMPSVMQTMRGIPASSASRIASAANGGGTKIMVALAPVFATASATVLNTGQPSCVVPPLPGVTPPTTLVPYSAQPFAWNVPSLPVIPCTISRVLLSTKTAMKIAPSFYCECECECDCESKSRGPLILSPFILSRERPNNSEKHPTYLVT